MYVCEERGGKEVGLAPVVSHQELTRLRIPIRQTVVRSDVELVDVSQASPPPVPPLPIWYRLREGGERVGFAAPKVDECSAESARVGAHFAAGDMLMLNVQSKQCSGDCAECLVMNQGCA